ncbi:MAG: LA_3696 family protein [Anaerolineae bacterium]
MTVINIPRTLREQLGDQGADDLVDLLNRVSEDTKRDTLVLAEEKFERRLGEEASAINQHTTGMASQLNQRITEVESGLNQRLAEVESGLNRRLANVKTEVAETKAELVRWMFVFWVGQLAAILGILFVFFK